MVSIVILSFNTSKLLYECLRSTQKALSTFDHEIIVVDNLSQDDSVEMVKREFKEVKLIQNTKNEGFAKGCNLGAKHAKGKYLLFLNSDTEMKIDSLSGMVAILDKDENVAVVGGLLKNFDGTSQRSFGPFYGIKEVVLMLFGGEKAELTFHHKNDASAVDWVSGGFMMVRKEIFDTIHGFDEHFFMYIEDMELCYRIKKRGYAVIHDPKSSVSHLGQGSSNKGFAIVHIYKGLRYFYKKHKDVVSYAILVCLLYLKGWSAILIGGLKGDRTLVTTYQKALA